MNQVLQSILSLPQVYCLIIKIIQHQTHQNTLITTAQDKQVEALTPCMRQHDRFIDPSGKLLQPGAVIVCEDLPFAISSNVKIYNFTGGSMKQLYITDSSEHKFLVKATNSPSTFSNIFISVLGLLPRF